MASEPARTGAKLAVKLVIVCLNSGVRAEVEFVLDKEEKSRSMQDLQVSVSVLVAKLLNYSRPAVA